MALTSGYVLKIDDASPLLCCLPAVMHDPDIALRAPLLSSSFNVTLTTGAPVDDYPCIVLCGEPGVGKSSYLNFVAYSQRPRDDQGRISHEAYERTGQTIRR